MPGIVEQMSERQEISVELKLANRVYPLRVGKAEETSVQEAAELINFRVKEMQDKYSVRDIQDLLAMTALQIATQLIEIEKNHSSLFSQVNDDIDQMEELIKTALSGS